MADKTTASSGSSKQPSAGNPNGPNGDAMKMPDPAAMGKAMTDIAERSQRLVSDFLARQTTLLMWAMRSWR